MTSPTAKAVLQRNWLFRDLPERALDDLGSLASRRVYAKGATIFSQGDEGDALYSVASGQVRITTRAPDGRVAFLNIVDHGQVFGEIAVMDGLPRTAGAEAMEETVLLKIRQTDFLRLLEREPSLAVHLLKMLCERVRYINELVEESAFLAVPGRLAKRLLHLAARYGRTTAEGNELHISQAELAHFLSVSRQIVNQHLQDWKAQGWVDLARSKIIICDGEALQSIVD